MTYFYPLKRMEVKLLKGRASALSDGSISFSNDLLECQNVSCRFMFGNGQSYIQVLEQKAQVRWLAASVLIQARASAGPVKRFDHKVAFFKWNVCVYRNEDRMTCETFTSFPFCAQDS